MTSLEPVPTRRHPIDWRGVAAIMLGLAALATALAARGPAIAERAEYSWPPPELPSASPARTWYAPLLVARHEAEQINARIPCGSERALSGAGRSVTLFATTRDWPVWHGLAAVRRPDGNVTINVGRQVLGRYSQRLDGSECNLDIVVEGLTWRIRQDGEPTDTGEIERAPMVSGLYTELDLRSEPGLSVSVLPYAQDTRPSTRQTFLRLLTLVLLSAAVLAITRRPGKRRPRLNSRPRIGAQDGLVAAVLAFWWFLAPLHFDDGWVRARQLNALASGGFSSYYEHWGANLPLATWLEWLQQFVVAHTSSLVLDRLPTVAVLAATWIVCRHCLVHLLNRGPSRRDIAWWAGGIVFAVGAAAFGMTMRPEPAVALLSVGVLACCIRYARSPTIIALVAGVVLCGLAVTIHPAGAVAVAPLIVCVPRAWRDARAGVAFSPLALGALIPIGLAWSLLLAYLDSDATHRSESVELIRRGGWHNAGPLQEHWRYGYLSDVGASPLRREFVVLLLLAVAAWLAVRSPPRTLMDRLPVASIAIGLLLLAVTPSKWIWHFGGLIGYTAVAIGFESSRLEKVHLSWLKRAGIVLAVLFASLWAVTDRNAWGPLDFGNTGWLRLPILFVAATVVGGVASFALGRTRRTHLLVTPTVAAAILATTVVTFAAEAATTNGWSTFRQSLASVARRDHCGLASNILVPTIGSMRPLTPIDVGEPKPQLASDSLRQRALLAPRPASERIYWLSSRAIGVFVRGDHAPKARLWVVWGRVDDAGFHVQRSGSVQLPSPAGGYATEWTLITERLMPPRPRGANAVLLDAVRKKGEPTRALLTRPVAFESRRLDDLLANGTHAVVDPFLFEATPCAPLPQLVYGVADPPTLLLEWHWGPDFASLTSPFRGVVDAFTRSMFRSRASKTKGSSSRTGPLQIGATPRLLQRVGSLAVNSVGPAARQRPQTGPQVAAVQSPLDRMRQMTRGPGHGRRDGIGRRRAHYHRHHA
jgi:hypothetical protein